MKVRRINLWKNLLFVAMIATSLISGIDTAHAALGVDFAAPDSTYLVPGTNGIAGWSFTANQDLYVKALGIYDHDADRTHEYSHSIGLWKADGTLMNYVSFVEPPYPHQGELVNGKYHMVNINATLRAGQKYVIAATMGTSDPFVYFDSATVAAAHNLTFSSYLTYEGAVYSDSLIGMPASDPLSAFGNFGANIDVVPTPIPAAAWLLGSGLMGLVGLRRRKQN